MRILYYVENSARKSARKWFLYTATHYLGTPYIWGGDDPAGFDCSGFVVECLKSVGLLPLNSDFTAEELRHRFCDKEISQPSKGCLLFRLNIRRIATHVSICLDSFFQISASGGNSTVITHSDAEQQNAYIRIRPITIVENKTVISDPFINVKD